MDGGREKKFAVENIERNSEPIALLCDNIFYFAELGMQEFETSGLMMQILEKTGFTIERNPSGMPTGFIASYGSGKPVIALHTEFDATPGCSQAPVWRSRRRLSMARRAIPRDTTSMAR